MKRIALVLAASLLGAGCIVHDNPDDCATSSVTFEWDFQRWDGSPPTGCALAGVDAVDVYVDGGFVASYPCTDGGARVAGLAPGSHHVTAEGIDVAAGRIAYRDQRTFQTSGCGNQLLAVRPAEGTVNLDYSDAGCTSSPCYLWFAIHDDVAETFAAVIDTASPAAVKVLYPYPDDVVVRLPAGSFTLDWMEQVTASFAGQAISCTSAAFDVAAAAQTPLPVSLACLP